MFISTKKFGPISTCHRNWKAAENKNRDSRKCSYIHGYSRHIEILFIGETDEHQWVMDFGDLKDVKSLVEGLWDHAVLVSSNDPEIETLKELDSNGLIKLTIVDVDNGLNWGPGIEGSCKQLFDMITDIVKEKTEYRVGIKSVRIWEHENNSAIYIGNKQDYMRHGYQRTFSEYF